MEYVYVAEITDLQTDTMIKVHAGDAEILIANIDGAYYALDNRCPHMSGSLADGRLEGSVVVCPRHGASFDVRTGKAVRDPRLMFIRMKVNDARVLPVRIDGTRILVGIG